MAKKLTARGSGEVSPDRVQRENARFEAWRKRNPSKPFKDYFAATVKLKLEKGKPHATLGANLCTGEYKAAGSGILNRLVARGLKPTDVCVDYGCGTLRVGQHFISHLQPGAFWGLDIADFLLEEGRKLIGEELWSTKKPNLRVISPEAVAEAAAAKPKFLYSTAVLLHVHPDELPEYVGNVMTLIASGGQAIIHAHLSAGETYQYSGRSWAHSEPVLARMFAERGGKMDMLSEEEETELEGFGKTLRRCFLLVVPVAGGSD